MNADEPARLFDAIQTTLRDVIARSTRGDTVRQVIYADFTLQYCPTCQTGGKPLADRVLSRLLK